MPRNTYGIIEEIENIIVPIRDNLKDFMDLYEILDGIPVPADSRIIRPGDFVTTTDGTIVGIISRADSRRSNYFTFVIVGLIGNNYSSVISVDPDGNYGPLIFGRLSSLGEVKRALSVMKEKNLGWNPISLQISQED
jgi:hypothetical protein